MSNTVAQIRELLATLPEKQRAQVMAQVNWSSVNFMTMTEEQAQALLAKLNVAIAQTNPLKDSMDERLATLNAKKAESTSVWETARKAYYQFVAQNDINDNAENRQKADDLFSNMKLAGEDMVENTKRANDAEIQNILFNA